MGARRSRARYAGAGSGVNRDTARSRSGSRSCSSRRSHAARRRTGIEYEVDLDKLYDFVDSVIHQAEAGSAISRTLFELLFPHRVKLDLDPSENLAPAPRRAGRTHPAGSCWPRSHEGDTTALSLRAGMLRQLHSHEQYSRALGAAHRPAGAGHRRSPDPSGSAAGRAPRAVTGARVARRAQMDGHRRDHQRGSAEPDDAWIEMPNDAARTARIAPCTSLHSGVFDAADPERSGVVIGPCAAPPPDRARLPADDRLAPDLVFHELPPSRPEMEQCRSKARTKPRRGL